MYTLTSHPVTVASEPLDYDLSMLVSATYKVDHHADHLPAGPTCTDQVTIEVRDESDPDHPKRQTIKLPRHVLALVAERLTQLARVLPPARPGDCFCGPDHTGENPDDRPTCPQHGLAADAQARLDAERDAQVPEPQPF